MKREKRTSKQYRMTKVLLGEESERDNEIREESREEVVLALVEIKRRE